VLTSLLGVGLSLIGFCCGGLGAAAAGTVAASSVADGVRGPVAWPFWVAGAALFLAAALVHRSSHRRPGGGCCSITHAAERHPTKAAFARPAPSIQLQATFKPKLL